jgi:ribosome-associated protein
VDVAVPPHDAAGGPAPSNAVPAAEPSTSHGSLRVNRNLTIPLSEIAWRATTPGGPGGQHANRTASRVEVRFDVEASQSLGPRQRSVLLDRLGPVVTASAADERSQARNRQLALERLAAKVAGALRVRPPRRPTAPTKAARERRLEEKRHRSGVKRARRAPSDDE